MARWLLKVYIDGSVHETYFHCWCKSLLHWQIICGDNVISACYTDVAVNTMRPRKNGCHFPDNIFRCVFFYESWCILIEISLKFLPKGPINNSIGSDNGLVLNRSQAIIWTKDGLVYHIEAKTKWPLFRRRHFETHFLEWKCWNFD